MTASPTGRRPRRRVPGRPGARCGQGNAGGPSRPEFDIVARFAGYADEVVCLATPALFFCRSGLPQLHPRPPTTRWWRFWIVLTAASPRQVRSIPLTHHFAMRRSGRCRSVPVAGHLTVPEKPGDYGFAHGSGSSRHSIRNRYIARSGWVYDMTFDTRMKENYDAASSDIEHSLRLIERDRLVAPS